MEDKLANCRDWEGTKRQSLENSYLLWIKEYVYSMLDLREDGNECKRREQKRGEMLDSGLPAANLGGRACLSRY